MTSDEVHESLEDNTSYLFSNDNQLATSFQEKSRRDNFVNSEPTCYKTFPVSPPKPSLTSKLVSNFWIPPPVKSPEERGCDKGEIHSEMVWGQSACNAAYDDLMSTKLLDVKSQEDIRCFFLINGQ